VTERGHTCFLGRFPRTFSTLRPEFCVKDVACIVVAAVETGRGSVFKGDPLSLIFGNARRGIECSCEFAVELRGGMNILRP